MTAGRTPSSLTVVATVAVTSEIYQLSVIENRAGGLPGRRPSLGLKTDGKRSALQQFSRLLVAQLNT